MTKEPLHGATSPSKPTSIFRSTPEAVKTLRRSSRKRILDIDSKELQSELTGESDRASIILLTGLIEEALTYRITENFRFKPNDDEIDHLFRFEGPMGTFSAKAEVACVFGFIDDVTFNQINTMRELRNACAHSKQPLSFADSVLTNVARRMFDPTGVLPQPVGSHKGSWKAFFIAEGIVVLNTLLMGSREDAKIMLLKAIGEVFKIWKPAPSPSPDISTQP